MRGGTTPEWLLRSEVGLCPCCRVGRRRPGRVIEKTLEGLASVMRQALASEEIAGRPGLLQRLDPRAKLLSFAALLIAVALVRHLPALAGLYLATLALAAASRLRLSWFVKRVWLFVPIFTGIVVLPASFGFITPGEVVVPLGHWFGHEVGLTRQGLTSAALVVCRVATSISLVVLLTLTTPWPRLLEALRALFVPRTLVLVAGMAFRYLFVLLDSASDMYVAREARMLGGRSDGGRTRALVVSSAGALFGKAHALGEEVHQAMLARGFRGDARTLDRFRLRLADGACLAASVALAVLAIGGDRALGL
jgi:cobalt/nickel transport system permease protein